MAPLNDTDVGLLARIAQHDAQAFDAFYTHHAASVFSLALAILRDQAEAADLTQEVFLLVWRHARSYRPTGSPKSWLLRLTRNRAIDELRRQRRHEPHNVAMSADLLQTLPAPPASSDPAERRAVREALDTLPAMQREALVLAFFHGLSHQEIATHLRTPLGTIKARIRRALHTLLQQFQDEEHTPDDAS
jgi:RNA polymerase sigma-70 factor (ECF subfamily)